MHNRDILTGFEYPFYYVVADVWNPKTEEYEREKIATMQTYEEAISFAKATPVNEDTLQVEVFQDNYEDDEVVAIKVAVSDDPPGYYFYNPLTEKEIK